MGPFNIEETKSHIFVYEFGLMDSKGIFIARNKFEAFTLIKEEIKKNLGFEDEITALDLERMFLEKYADILSPEDRKKVIEARAIGVEPIKLDDLISIYSWSEYENHTGFTFSERLLEL